MLCRSLGKDWRLFLLVLLTTDHIKNITWVSFVYTGHYHPICCTISGIMYTVTSKKPWEHGHHSSKIKTLIVISSCTKEQKQSLNHFNIYSSHKASVGHFVARALANCDNSFQILWNGGEWTRSEYCLDGYSSIIVSEKEIGFLKKHVYKFGWSNVLKFHRIYWSPSPDQSYALYSSALPLVKFQGNIQTASVS